MHKSICKINLFSIAAFLIMLVTGCQQKDIFIPDSPLFPKTPYASPLTKAIADRVNLIKKVVADTLTTIASGVNLTTINYIDYADNPMRVFVLEVDLNNSKITLKAGTPYNKPAYAQQAVTEIAAAQDTVGNKVLAAINGDFFNVTTSQPQSILYKNGVSIKPLSQLCPLCTYLSINNANSPVIGTKTDPVDATTIRDAVGGYHLLIKDSVRITQGDLSVAPRTAVGVTADKKVYLVVADGRNPDYSNGMSFAQLSNLFFALSVKDAINMDGGGSSTMVVKSGAGWVVKNKPSDGFARPVANAWTVVDTQ